MEGAAATVSDVLHEVAETHHVVYRIVDGVDDDWASWYSEWLIKLSRCRKSSGTSQCAAS